MIATIAKTDSGTDANITFAVVTSAKVDDATQTDVTELEWFKIYEDGLTVTSTSASNGKAAPRQRQRHEWAADRLIANKGKVSFTIPPCIASGHYLLRHEIIGASSARALRSARGTDGGCGV